MTRSYSRRTSSSSMVVSGTLGGPGAALAAWERGDLPHQMAHQRFLHPQARLHEGAWLAANGARAMIDVSDGLAADAQHLAAANSLVASIDVNKVPHFSFVTPHEALASGEEYELLVAFREPDTDRIAAAFERQFALPLTRIGVLEAIPTGNEHDTNSPARVELPGGHDHFSR